MNAAEYPKEESTDEGSASLADLFRGRSQLRVFHFMFGPDYTDRAPKGRSETGIWFRRHDEYERKVG